MTRVERLTPDDYFREAAGLLVDDGPDALTIAALCERLGSTKGSFYHHFGGLPGFVAQLADYWDRETASRLVRVSRVQPDPALRIAALTEMCVGLPHGLEAAMRTWARSNPELAVSTARVDRRRERHLAEAACALGVDRAHGRLLARMALDLLVGVQQREHPVDGKRLRRELEEINRLVFVEADPRRVARLRAASAG